MGKKIVKVSRTEFQLEDGLVFPIEPPLDRDMSAEEFQVHYERVCNIVGGIQNVESDSKNIKDVG